MSILEIILLATPGMWSLFTGSLVYMFYCIFMCRQIKVGNIFPVYIIAEIVQEKTLEYFQIKTKNDKPRTPDRELHVRPFITLCR